MMLMANLHELIRSGMSGLSRARVHADTDVSIAEDNAENDDMRIYVNDAALTSAGTNAAANFSAAPTNTRDIMAPRISWNIIRL